jgi:ketosteroid isomerase-like protein
MSNKDEVREASNQFYKGLNRMIEGDLSVLEGIWSHEATVTAMHPVGERDVSWEEVRNSFVPFTEMASDGKIELRDQLINVLGDVAYEVGVESGQFKLAGNDIKIGHRVTNIYRREGGSWKMIHHHTDISQPMVDVISSLPQEKAKVRR